MPLARRGPGLIGTAARTAVFAGTATAVSGRVSRRQHKRWAEEDAAAYEQQQAESEQQAAAAPAQAPEEPGYVVELQQLAQLRDQGILTPEEFETKKKQLLGL
jgi:Short C-terminal domain